MESSQVLGDPEKWSTSSESGWTMYIGSQISYDGEGDDDNNDGGGDDDDDVCFITDKEKHDKRNDNNNDDDDDNNNSDNDNNNDEDHESDDSMASDASSGPTLQEFPCGNKEDLLRSHAFIVDRKKYSSGKKACKQLQKNKRDERKNTKAQKQHSVRKADSAASQV
ncbi:protein SOB FIVE-LIKE 2 [Ziziphus jujuba]|uniref:Protein SOB FIVE-LIKE 2 n=1 Tax=Ziziphus jujuba TaxID=326968 RepID=A0A6P4AJV3_ZIZJJ|nr:protein SOB FIVE-LIKE 2 [Ziziphus jujuba]